MRRTQSEIIDISVSLTPEMPVWPGNTGLRIVPLKRMANGDTSNVSALDEIGEIGTQNDNRSRVQGQSDSCAGNFAPRPPGKDCRASLAVTRRKQNPWTVEPG